MQRSINLILTILVTLFIFSLLGVVGHIEQQDEKIMAQQPQTQVDYNPRDAVSNSQLPAMPGQ